MTKGGNMSDRKPKTKPLISAQWLGIDEVHAYFGGILSRSEVERLMKENHIRSRWAKGRISAHVKDVQQWDEDIRRATDTETTKILGAGFIVPVDYILQAETGKRGRYA